MLLPILPILPILLIASASYAQAQSQSPARAQAQAQSRTQSQSQPQQGTGEIAFKQSYEASLERTEFVPIQRSIVEQRSEALSQAKGALLPSIGLNADYLYRDDTSAGGGDVGRALTQRSVWNASVGLTQPLFDGLRRLAALRIARQELQAQEQLTEQRKLDLFAETAEAHYAVIANERDLFHLRQLLELTEKRAEELRERVRVGRSRTSELLTTQSQAAVLKSQIRAAEGALTESRARYHRLTGLPAESPLSAAGFEVPSELKKLDAFVSELESRPDLRASQSLVEAADSRIDLERSGHFPQLTFGANYYLRRTGVLANSKWDLGVGLTFPIFQGGIVQSSVRESAALTRQRQLELSSLRRQALTEVRTAYATVASGVEQTEALRSALKIAERNLKEQQNDYRYGQATNLDVLQALNTFQDTKRVLDRTRYQTIAAYAALLAATGKTQ